MVGIQVLGSVLDVDRGIIAYQVHCDHSDDYSYLMSLVKSKYPQVIESYHGFLNEYGLEGAYGTTLYSKINDGLVIAQMYSQYDRDETEMDLFKLERCLYSLRSRAESEKLPVYIPYKLGTIMSQSYWSTIESLLRVVFNDNEVEAYIVMRGREY